MTTLRPYQQECLNKILWAYNSKLEGNNLIVLPTGAGKSLVISAIAQYVSEPVLILQPTKEILEQNVKKLMPYVGFDQVGIYSASMGEKTIRHFTFATIQSIYKKPELFERFKLVILDECHLYNARNTSGMLSTFLKSIGCRTVIGLTATPYRMAMGYTMDNGMLTAHATIKLINRTKPFFWNRLLYAMNISDLIEQKYLVPLEYYDRSIMEHENLRLNISRTDFDLEDLESLLSEKQQNILAVIQHAESVSKNVLVFCSSLRQAEKLSLATPNSAFVTGKTPKKERERIINQFKDGTIKTVFNMGVLTTGFDFCELDCIILLRPTRSIALYYQMLGRGVRRAEGKTHCKVFDLTSTVQNIGTIESIKLEKIDLKWNVTSSSKPNGWHNEELYRFTIKPK